MSDDQKKTVLVVEDQDEISKNMIGALTRKGYRVQHASDADSAMELAEQNHLSLILTDLDLPTLGQLMDQLGAHAKLKNMPVAVIDINHPKDPHPHLRILHSFEELDELLERDNWSGRGSAA